MTCLDWRWQEKTFFENAVLRSPQGAKPEFHTGPLGQFLNRSAHLKLRHRQVGGVLPGLGI
jgi:hypothetical protein